MKKRFMSILLVLVMVLSLMPTFALNAAAEEGERVQVSQKTSDAQDGDLHMTKTLYRNSDGTYDIDIESWATGEVESQVVNEAVPTDFVLILDQSGSMYEQDIPTGYTAAGNQQWHPNDFLQVTVNNSGSRGNSMSVDSHDYYYNVPGTNEYYPVYWKNRPDANFVKIDDVRALDCTTYEGLLDIGGYTYENGNCDARYSDHMEPMYYRDADGSYYRIYTYSEGLALRYHVTMFYYDSNGNRHDLGTYTYTWASVLNNRVTFDVYTNNYYTRSGSWPRYSYTQHPISNGYKPYYTDANGEEHQLPGSWSVNGEGDVFYNGVLYEKNTEVTRVSALETAVTNFVDLVNSKAVTDGVNHKVAVVGFSDSNGRSDNTELLSTGSLTTVSGSSYNYTYKLFPYGVNYNGPEHNGTATVGGAGGISVANYQAALQDASTAEGVATLKQAAHAVTACGGTEPEYGFYMAENILKNRTDKTYTDANNQTQKRNTVVIFFTDGHPGNDDTSDQIAAANKVVTASNRLKTSAEFNYTKVYSIGVFDSGDNQPLTFTKTGQNDADAADNYISHRNISGTEYYFYRGNKVSETSYNDTIKDYMECVSSKYPNATNFLTHAGGTSDPGSKSNDRRDENQDQMTYYMRVNDAGGLERAFASIASTIDSSTTSANLNDSAVLRDTVYTGDFDVSGASVEAKSVKVRMEDGQVVETGVAGTASPTVTESVRTNGRLSVTGFDYSGLYTAANRPGEKLVVTIHNVEPKKGGHLWSNSGDASIYPGANSQEAVLGVSSPEENVARITRVIDFNAQMILATGMQRWKAVGDIKNGTYNVDDDGNFTYQLNSENQSSKNAVINAAYGDADTAMVFGNVWTQYTSVPASSVYYDDDLTGQAVNVGEGYGYNSGFEAEKAKTTFDGSGRIFFTFYGTGIDVYCTTDSESGIVSAAVYEVGETQFGEQMIPVGAKVQGPISVRNYSGDAVRYNTPTVSFRDLTANSYTIMLSANEAAKIKIDGVRVYNPVEAGTAAATELSKTDEADALYVNLHSLLLNGAKDNFSVTKPEDMNDDFDKDTISGVLFVDDAANLVTESHWYKDEGATEDTWHDEAQPVYQTQFDAYKTNSPNNEIYLAAKTTVTNEDGSTADKMQAITFQVNTTKAPAGKTIYIGLSAPDYGSGSGSVTVTGKLDPLPVTSVMDMYYPITVPANGLITITNVGDSMIAITNLKITHVPDAKGINAMPAADKKLAMRAFFMPVTAETVELAADALNNEPTVVDPEPTGEPDTPDTPNLPDDPTPTGEPETPDTPNQPDDPTPTGEPETPDTPDQPADPTPGWNGNSIAMILQNIFRNLLQSLGGLFSGLGNW